MKDKAIPSEIKITHIYKGKDEKSNFIEFISLHNGKTFLLKHDSFIKRYDRELIEAFNSSQAK